MLLYMDAINACTHVMSAEHAPGIGFLSMKIYTSVYGELIEDYSL